MPESKNSKQNKKERSKNKNIYPLLMGLALLFATLAIIFLLLPLPHIL